MVKKYEVVWLTSYEDGCGCNSYLSSSSYVFDTLQKAEHYNEVVLKGEGSIKEVWT